MKLTLPNVLTIIFVTLKLTGCISWSWVWVLAPTWIPFSILMLILALIGLVELSKK